MSAVNRQAAKVLYSYESCKTASRTNTTNHTRTGQINDSRITVTKLDVIQRVIRDDVTVLAKSPRQRCRGDPGCQTFAWQLNRTPKRRQRFSQQFVITALRPAPSVAPTLSPLMPPPSSHSKPHYVCMNRCSLLACRRFICSPATAQSICQFSQ